MSSRLKRQLLTLLDKDLEFRYTVAGYIGISEVLKRLDRHEEELVKLREDMVEGFNLLRRHIDALGARWGLSANKHLEKGLRA